MLSIVIHIHLTDQWGEPDGHIQYIKSETSNEQNPNFHTGRVFSQGGPFALNTFLDKLTPDLK